MRTQTSKGEERLSAQFDHKAIESKWQKAWEETGSYQPDIKRSKNSFYNLMMFPYPSALGLHVGNIYAFVGSDIYGRFKRMQGFDVFEPIGLDGFGIHSENFALKVGKHPMDLSKKTESNIYAQLHTIGNGFAWSHKLETYVSDYYKWTQWIFVQLFKKGLAYRAEASVNWCPSCLTVLADEQVVAKSKIKNKKSNIQIYVCERCNTEVVKKELEQWFFRITNYAEKLLSGLDKIDWSEKVKVAQRNWLGKSEGLLLKFESDIENNTLVEVFTTRPDTLYGVTFMALAPEHPQVTKILDKSKGLLKRQIQKYVADSLKKVQEVRKVSEVRKEETGEEPVKTGIKTPFHCTNPATGKKIPIFIADYVVMSYGTGAVMGVPAHDHRDYDFAKKYQIDIVEVIRSAGPANAGSQKSEVRSQNFENPKSEIRNPKSASATRSTDQLSQQAFTEYGVLINSEQFSGLNSQEAIGAITSFAVKKGFGKKKIMWHLRDWLISRQRYWGAPIPMIFCKSCEEAGKSWFTTPEAKKYQVRENEKIPNTKYLIQNTAAMRGWYPVPESDLPVELPYIKNFKPTETGVSPLAQDPNFVKVKCPECGSEARRETDVSDTFLDSAWYFLRYPSVGIDAGPVSSFPPASARSSQKPVVDQKDQVELRAVGSPSTAATRKSGFPWNRQITRRWLPVDMYIGGAEHSVLHLLYSRFLWKAFYDFGYFDFSAKSPKGQLGGPAEMPASGWEEPFSKFRAHGLLISEGAKMSKSKGNVVLPDPYIEKYGADTLRTYLMFCGRFDQGGDFRDTGIEGMNRFLKRVWRLVIRNSKFEIRNSKLSSEAAFMMHRTIKKVTEDIENLRYNTAISAIMEWINFLEEKVAGSKERVAGSQSKNKLQTTNYELITEEEVRMLLLLLAPFAPFMTEELWQRLEAAKVSKGTKGTKASDTSDTFDTFDTFDSIHIYPWPKYDEKAATSQKIELIVEVNGKVRDRVVVDRGIEKEDAQKLALDLENTRKYLAGKVPKKAIFIKGRLINFVV